MQTDTFYVSMRKCAGWAFGTNGVIPALFVSQKRAIVCYDIIL